MIIYGEVHISGTVLDNVSSNYHPTPHDFMSAAGPNSDTERTNVVMSVVNLLITYKLLEHIKKKKTFQEL